MNKHAIIRIIRISLKTLVALAAAFNLVALFVFHYETPSWLRRGQEEEVVETTVKIDPELISPTTAPAGSDISFSIPVVPVNYSGERDMDSLVMDGVYVQGGDDQPIEDARIQYEILPGESRLKKVIEYTATLPDGRTLVETRAMNLTARYTGPVIALLGPIPEIDPAEADVFVGRLGVRGIIRADDGFGNDVTDQLVVSYDGLSDEEPDAVMTLALENQIHDTYDMDLTVHVKDYSGIVLVLTDYNLTLRVGDDFDPYDYIEYAHDVDGTDMMDRIQLSNHVDTDTPGEYYAVYWVWNDDHTAHSPDRYLYVTVEAEPEETEETGEAP